MREQTKRGGWYVIVEGVRSAEPTTKAEAKLLARDLRYAFGKGIAIAVRQGRP